MSDHFVLPKHMTNRHGEKIYIKGMTDAHLTNTLKLLLNDIAVRRALLAMALCGELGARSAGLAQGAHEDWLEEIHNQALQDAWEAGKDW
jgi:hypothetical protein